MRGFRKNRYSRRNLISVRRSQKSTIIIAIVAFVLLCLIISVVIGLILGKKADKIDTKPRYDFSDEDYISNNKTVKSVDAFAYSFGADLSGYLNRGISDFSLCLRNEAGKVMYKSRLAEEFSINSFAEEELDEYVSKIHEYEGYVCAYFYVRSFACEDKTMRELYKSYEIALLCEASELGVDDILLLGLDINQDNADEIEAFVNKVSLAVGDTVVGVNLVPEVFSLSDKDLYLASRIRGACDYVAMDFTNVTDEPYSVEEGNDGEGDTQTELEALTEKMYYYIKAYSARIILSRDNSYLYDSAKELGIKNIQIVGK